MATVSFTNKPVTETTQALAKAPTTTVGMVQNAPQLEGEFTSRDVAIPYLSLVQKSGTLVDEHPDWLGKWVLDKTWLLGDKITVVVCRIKKYYEEVTEFGDGIIPQRFATAEAARKEAVEVRDVADVDMLIAAPNEGVAENAILEHGEVSYIPGRYTVRSTAYGKIVGCVLKDFSGWLKQDLASGFYEIGVVRKTGAGNSWFAPTLKTAGKVEPALRKLITEKLGV